MEFIDIYDDLGQKNGRSGIVVLFPDMLDISFSGHIQAGETPLEAVCLQINTLY